MRIPIGASFIALAIVACAHAASAAWQPADIRPSQADLREILAANARASGSADARFAQRREHWTYHTGTRTGTRRLAVDVAVRGDDFRTSLELDGLTFMAGRKDGVRWRADGNGAVHEVAADLQGDPLDRAPQAVFALAAATCSLAGEARLPAPAWVVATHRAADKPAFLYVDEATATIVREVMRDGKHVITTNFDDFAPSDGALRARHWRVSDDVPADAIDVTVDAIAPDSVATSDIDFPARRLFAPAAPLEKSIDLDAAFEDGRISIKVDVGGRRVPFVLDTGTASIIVDPRTVHRAGTGATLSHTVLPRMSVGALGLERVSVLTVPLGIGGILGYDFFLGNVVEIDYPHRRVRVLCPADARSVFADPATTVVPANVAQGLPLVHAGFGAAQSDAFALDTGSPRLYVMRPFMSRFADEIGAHWSLAGPPFIEEYLEGGIEIQPYRVALFAFANTVTHDLTVGGQIPTTRTDDLTIPFDGIIGTDVLQNFDLYFDYDNARLGVRR